MDRVKVGPPLPAPLDAHQTRALQFADELRDARAAHAHVLRQALLSRKARVIMPRVAQEHRVSDLRAEGQGAVPQNEIGHLREAAQRHRVGGREGDVMLQHDFPKRLHCDNIMP